MPALSCPSCNSEHATWNELGTHFWKSHTPHSAGEICTECDYPVSEDGILFHLSCLSDTDSESVWTGLSLNDRPCPICGEAVLKSEVVSHVKNHEPLNIKEYLGEKLVCQICDGAVQGQNQHGEHQKCIIKALLISKDSRSQFSCPYCDSTTGNKGGLQWHLWQEHFETDGLEGDCPGCGDEITYEEVNNHILCRESGYGPATTDIFDVDIESCFLCDVSVLNPHVLRRHIKNKHLSAIEKRDLTCEVCGEKIQRQSIKEHYLCLAKASGKSFSFSTNTSWRCPVCSEQCYSEEKFLNHVSANHASSIFSADSCRICGESLSNIENHNACIDIISGTDLQATKESDITLPSVLRNQPSTGSYDPQNPLPQAERSEFYQGLSTFVERERESSRKENWQLYKDLPLGRLVYKQDLIFDLVSTGRHSHPNYDLQYVFELPVEDDEDVEDVDGLTDRFGIYPKQEVIVGTESNLGCLPIKAEVTFTDDFTIGLSPDPDGDYSTSKLDSALTQDKQEYHVVHLLEPTPYNRKQDAISRVRDSNFQDSVVCGDATISETPRSIGSLPARELNEKQQSAVGRALGNPDICCIHGPPGTGKTRTLRTIIELAVARGDRVLACSHSNQAIDNLLVGGSTVKEPDKDSLHSFALNTETTVSRIGSNSENRVVQKFYQQTGPNDADIVASTTSAAAELDRDSFDLVLIDEATQADKPATFIPFLRGDNLVLAGDHKQLPPFCSNETAKEQDMHISLFEHIKNIYGEQVFTKLTRQYRMNSEIATFPNDQFYSGELEHGDENIDWRIKDRPPIVGHHVVSHEQTDEETQSRYNPREAQEVAKQVRLLQIEGVEPSNIGVITAYSAQINAIDDALRNEKIEKPHLIEVDTIDSFQGTEREAIIVSFVRSNDYNASGFLTFPEEGKRRLNVAMTRAKKRLVLIGDFVTLSTQNKQRDNSCATVYTQMKEFLDQNGRLKDHTMVHPSEKG